ncbi:MAG: serine/threonine protein kinase [Bacteroidetes bacterium]|nr:serine/threonine protein kinase [Bacteroidota bacterium]
MSSEDFNIECSKDWKKIHEQIFGTIIPKHAEWTDIDDIVKVLNTIGIIPNSNHMFFPDGGGLDLEGAKLSHERKCIELLTGVSYIIKPRVLIFESIDSDLEWNYFRIETDILAASGVYELNADSFDEEVCELTPLQYVDRHHWDEGEYDGEKLPDTARPIIRYFKGSFVIFKKSSIYNNTTSTYDGRHAKVDANEFRLYIENACKSITV